MNKCDRRKWEPISVCIIEFTYLTFFLSPITDFDFSWCICYIFVMFVFSIIRLFLQLLFLNSSHYYPTYPCTSAFYFVTATYLDKYIFILLLYFIYFYYNPMFWFTNFIYHTFPLQYVWCYFYMPLHII